MTLRADAEKNRSSIVTTAAALFAASGAEVSLEEIARQAGVGIGTLYRRFPSRDALIEAVFDEKITRYAETAELAAERALTEPWAAFSEYVMFVIEQQATDAAFAEILNAPVNGSPLFKQQHRRSFRATLALVKRAKDAGVVRADFDHSDLYLVTLANNGIRDAAGAAPASWKRFGALMLDAFRADGQLPPVPAAWKRRP